MKFLCVALFVSLCTSIESQIQCSTIQYSRDDAIAYLICDEKIYNRKKGIWGAKQRFGRAVLRDMRARATRHSASATVADLIST